MNQFTIASFNVKNLIEAEEEYYTFLSYTEEEYAWKKDWLADQILTLGADIIGFQEIFSEASLRDVIDEADAMGAELNEASVPGKNKRYHKRAIFRRIKSKLYEGASLAFAPNANDGTPGNRRPGVAILSRFPFEGEPEVIQEINPPVHIPLEGGGFAMSRVSRPILKVRVNVHGTVITVFNCHLKSKLGEFDRQEGAEFAPEQDLVNYDPVGRAMGAARAAMRRMAEAWVLRRAIVAEIDAGFPVMVLGDFNDSEHSVSTEIISGEVPFKNYAWMDRHDAKSGRDHYTKEENQIIRDQIEEVRLESCETMFVQRSKRDMVFTSAFGGVFESIDQIFVSQQFQGGEGSVGEMEYFSVLNDHLTDGSHPEAPYNKLASDHGQVMAHFRLNGR
jgi:endonuclease/exonuclease/phosphatase family metal-dependent hydrolase